MQRKYNLNIPHYNMAQHYPHDAIFVNILVAGSVNKFWSKIIEIAEYLKEEHSGCI